MPKLLDVVKESGYSHQDVIDLIEKAGKPEPQEDEVDISIEEVVEDDLPEDDIELPITEDEEEPEEIDASITLTPEELTEKVKLAVAKGIRVKRKVPSKGKIRDKPSVEYGVSNRGYEELV